VLGQPLTFSTQHTRLTFIKQYFRWLARNNYILSNPASEIELPKLEKRLPKFILTAAESERVMAQPDLEKPTGMRDRSILEALYSTGVRRTELSRLKIHDIDPERGTLMVRQGKGRRGRVIPIGERGAAFVEKYVRDVRPSFLVEPDEGFLFLSKHGDTLSAKMLSILVGRYAENARAREADDDGDLHPRLDQEAQGDRLEASHRHVPLASVGERAEAGRPRRSGPG
jgi:integrase/recombinase XerD